jgi:hypothetical protein
MSQLEYNPSLFADPDFAEECAPCFDYFIDQLAKGVSKDIAIIDAFMMIRKNVSLANAYELAVAAECNPYVKERFDKVLAAKKPTELWSVNKSLHSLLRLVNDRRTRDSAKIQAIKELNVMAGITMVDEFGKTHGTGNSLSDFYAAYTAMKNGPAVPAAVTPGPAIPEQAPEPSTPDDDEDMSWLWKDLK